jgi:heptaprenyl diphosphate synthase
MKSSKTAFLGMFVAVAMIFSYIESHIPPLVSVPGIKLGLPNIAIIVILYKLGWKEALTVSLLRVVLSSLLFGSVLTMAYSIAGALLSLLVMVLMQKSKLFSTVTISVVGGVFHNIGQISVAILVLETTELIYYLPMLLLSGTIAGVVIGLIAYQTINKMKRIEF